MNRRDLLEVINLPDLISMVASGDAVRGLTRERGGVICDPRPGCTERSPSFSVYRQGSVWLWKRHGGDDAHGSAFDLLLAFGYTRTAAWDELARLAGVPLDTWTPSRPMARRDPLADAHAVLSHCSPLSPAEVSRAHSLVAPLREGDGASGDLLTRGLQNWPGLTAGKLRRDFITPDGRLLACAGALAFTVRGPDGLPWAVKVRNLGSTEALKSRNLSRYVYRIGRHGAPAWCSPIYGTGNALLIVEGELNGVAAARALEVVGRHIDVQGLAGAGGTPFLDGMSGRAVYVYADSDKPGQECVQRVARLAQAAGARTVRILPPLTNRDFCDVAGEQGVQELGYLLLDLINACTIHHTIAPSGATGHSIAPPHQTLGDGAMVQSAQGFVLRKYHAKLSRKLGGAR